MTTKPVPLYNEAFAKAVRYGALPLHHFTVPYFPVKALTTLGGLKKDEVYFCYLITDTGQLMLHGMVERTYPMKCFARPQLTPDNMEAVGKLMQSFSPPAEAIEMDKLNGQA